MAKKKELTVEEKLTELSKLQEIDSELGKIEVLKGELPIEVNDLEDEIEGLSKRVGRLQENIDQMNQENSRQMANIKDAQALIERYNKQLDEVKNNREYEALSKELELQSLEVELSEKRIRDEKVKIDGKNEVLEETKSRLKAKEETLALKKGELDKIIARTEKEEKKLLKDAEKQREKIETRLLKAYDKVRNSYRNGLAVVTVERNSCGGCFNKIPPQTQLEISLMNKIIVCEHCGRILVDHSIAGETVEE